MTQTRDYAVKTPPPGKVTFEEFLEWMDEDTHAEWVNGDIVMTSPASSTHQDILLFLAQVVRQYARANDLLGQVKLPFQMRLPNSSREPDIVFVNKSNQHRVQNTYLEGPADIAVEIVSPESMLRDYQTKFVEYAEGGVPEYWLIDPRIQEAHFYWLNTQQHFEERLLDEQGRYHSQMLPGLWLNPAWLWRVPLLEPEDVLNEIGGIGYSNYMANRFKIGGEPQGS